MKIFEIKPNKIYPFLKPCKLKGYIVGGGAPSVLVLPGGGYFFVSEREAAPVAVRFNEKGYNAFVLYYSAGKDAVYPMPLLQAAAAILYIRNNKETLGCANEVIPCGFSAGGHLASMCAVYYDKEEILSAFKVNKDDIKPSACILCYPVISATKSPHAGSFINLSGSDDTEKHKRFSTELAVNKETPPVFLWHTADDATVGVENSLVFAANCARYKTPFELHIFEKGLHGLSMCDETTSEGNPQMVNPRAAKWFDLCVNWLDNLFRN
jgi:acetyl esterase/lipase